MPKAFRTSTAKATAAGVARLSAKCDENCVFLPTSVANAKYPGKKKKLQYKRRETTLRNAHSSFPSD